MDRTRWIGSIAIAVLWLAVPAITQARPIALAWDPNSEPGVTGYIIYYGTQSGIYPNSMDVGNVTTYQLDLPGVQYYFAVRAYNGTETSGLSAEVSDSSAITITSPGNQGTREGFAVNLPILASGSSLTFSASNLPAGLSINPSTGVIAGTVSAGGAGSSPYFVSVTVSNGSGNTTSLQFTWIVSVNLAPSLTNPGTQVSAQNGSASLPLSASDPDGDGLSFTVTGLPPLLTVNAVTGLISGTLSATSAGTYTVTATVSDGSLTSSQTFTWNVSGPGGLLVDAVVFSDGNSARTTPPFSTTVAGETLLAFVSSSGPTTAAQTSTVTGAGLTWTMVKRTNTQIGTAEIWKATAAGMLSNVTVTATQALTGYPQSLTVVTFPGAGGTGAVGGANAPSGAPTVSLTSTQPGSLVFAVGQDWDSATARALGSNQTLTHEWDDTVGGNTFWVQRTNGPVPVAGTLVTLNDTAPTADRWNFAAVEVVPAGAPVNRAPSLTNPGTKTSAESTVVALQLVATDLDGNPLTYAATGLPAALTLNTSTGLISGTLSYTSAGVYTVTATASDGALSNSQTFTWNVTNVNRPPTITAPASQSSAPGATATMTIVATDADGDTLAFSAAGLPTGLTINTGTGVIGGTIAADAAATYAVTITVSDGALAPTASFWWVVTAAGPPQWSSGDPRGGDYDGDGKIDPAVYRPSNGGWYILKSSTNYTSSLAVSWGLSSDVPVPGDYDGDRKTDPAVYRPSTGHWHILKSSANYTASMSFSWGLSTDMPVPADYDGDGQTDPAVFRPSTGGWHVLKSSGNYTASISVVLGVSTDTRVQADYDGDGKADPAIFRPSTGLWTVLKSSTSYTTTLSVSWGLSTDVPVPGDFDGDGKFDPAVFRPSTGGWFALKSSANYGSSFGVSWGRSTDNPAPGDFDGDGKCDPVIFRPSTGGWHMLQSSAAYGASTSVSWGLSSDSPLNKRQ